MLRWASRPAANVVVNIGDDVVANCVVADDHAVGLQHTASLGAGAGMLFRFDPPQSGLTFHMGTVAYPIDIIFVSTTRRVAKVVHNAQPGTRERWRCDAQCAYVVELPGRTAGRVVVGQAVTVSDDGYRPEADAPGTPQRDRILLPNDQLQSTTMPPDRRFIDSAPPDQGGNPNADQMAPQQWQQTLGPDIHAPMNDPNGQPALRALGQRIADPVDYIMAVIEQLYAQPTRLQWHPDQLNRSLSYAMVSPTDVMSWVGNNTPEVADAVSTDAALQTLGDGVVLAGLAQVAHVAHGEHGPLLILWRQNHAQ